MWWIRDRKTYLLDSWFFLVFTSTAQEYTDDKECNINICQDHRSKYCWCTCIFLLGSLTKCYNNNNNNNYAKSLVYNWNFLYLQSTNLNYMISVFALIYLFIAHTFITHPQNDQLPCQLLEVGLITLLIDHFTCIAVAIGPTSAKACFFQAFVPLFQRRLHLQWSFASSDKYIEGICNYSL